KLYKELEDWRGMVQLYEDQILRGKDPASRAELARHVARLWEERLGDAREAADAWRRVLRMKKEDPEATEGLDRAKKGMLNVSQSPPAVAPKAATAPPPAAPPPASAPPPAPPPPVEAEDDEPEAVTPAPTLEPVAAGVSDLSDADDEDQTQVADLDALLAGARGS